ncbi:hypothetical protein AeRB84_015564 [Aphanomyces euteiches]|nr:hypothetical protein AeRB84_015564 [Aphanomyces euteiches]
MFVRKWRPVLRRNLSSLPSANIEPIQEYLDHIASPSQVPSDFTPREIHHTAVVHPNASLGYGVQIGPYCVVGPDVVLHDNVVLKSHVVVEGVTTIGENTILFPFGCIGGPPQDKKHVDGGPSSLVIGKNNLIREHVTINCGTSSDAGTTRVGDGCWECTSATTAKWALESFYRTMFVWLGTFLSTTLQLSVDKSGSSNFLAMIGGKSAVDGDVLPYGLVLGNRARLIGLNLVGLRRMQTSRSVIKDMLQTYRYIYNVHGNHFAPPLPLEEHVTRLARAEEARKYFTELGRDNPLLNKMIDFVRESPLRHRSTLCPADV